MRDFRPGLIFLGAILVSLSCGDDEPVAPPPRPCSPVEISITMTPDSSGVRYVLIVKDHQGSEEHRGFSVVAVGFDISVPRGCGSHVRVVAP